MSGSALLKTYLVRIHLRHAVPIDLRFVDPNKAIEALKTASEARQRQSEVLLRDDGATELHCNGVDIVASNIIDVANETELALRMAADIARTGNAVKAELAEQGLGNLLGVPEAEGATMQDTSPHGLLTGLSSAGGRAGSASSRQPPPDPNQPRYAS
jgi:hypothetical protein